MAAMPSLTIIKDMRYRDVREEWSNTYHFEGPPPSSVAAWKAFADQVIEFESLIIWAGDRIIRANGHLAGQPAAAWEHDYLAAGTETTGRFAPTVDYSPQAGDTAAWIRYTTTQVNKRGKPIYLRSYYHHAAAHNVGDTVDTLDPHWISEAQAYGNLWVSGIFDGTNWRHRAGPNGAVAQLAEVAEYMTTRTLKRRGKRKRTVAVVDLNPVRLIPAPQTPILPIP